MARYVVVRLLQTILIVFAVSIIVFGLTRILPGGTARAILGNRASDAAIRAFNSQNGLNLPVPLQYYDYMVRLLHGNLGYSYKLGQPVSTLIAERLPKTIFLSGVGLVVGLIVAIPLGIFQAIRQARAIDHGITGLQFLVYSMPSFWLAILLILFFSVQLGLLPSEAPQSDSLAGILSQPAALILPVFVTSIYSIASLSRYMRSSTIENLIRDYVLTALSKGLTRRRVLFRHVMKNALIPIVTLIGLSIPGLVSGSVIVETVFNYPGVGLLYDSAANDRDYPILLAVVLLASFATAMGSLLADLLYVAVNPQIRYRDSP